MPENREHGSVARQCLHQSSARCNQLQSVPQAEHSRDAGGHVFADAMARDGIGLDAPGFERTCERIFDGKQGGLSIRCFVEHRALTSVRVKNIFERLVQFVSEDCAALTERVPKHGLSQRQLSSHACILRPLSRK